MGSVKRENSCIVALVHPGFHQEAVLVSPFASSSSNAAQGHHPDTIGDPTRVGGEVQNDTAKSSTRREGREQQPTRLERQPRGATNPAGQANGTIDSTLDSSQEWTSTASTNGDSDSPEDALREILSSSTSKRARWEDAEDAHRGSLLRVQKEMEKTILDMRNKLKERDDRIAALERDVTDQTQRKLNWHKRSNQLAKERDDASRQSTAAQRKLEYSERKCAHLEGELWTTKDLLKVRTDELTVAQAFMTTADRFSVTDMRRMVEEINNDIYQCSVLLADMVLDSLEGEHNDVKELEKAHDTLVSAYGRDITTRLQSDTSQGDTVVFECVVQNIIVTRCCSNFHSLYPENENVNTVLRSLRERVLRSHELSIAKNWVAMLTAQFQDSQEDPTHTLRFLTDLMLVAGWRPNTTSPTQPPAILTAKYQEITTRTLKLRGMAAEGILSQDIEVYTVPSGTPYVPNEMQDAFECGRGAKVADGRAPEDIICSTTMGIRSVKRMLPSNSSSQNRRTRTEEVILKPKVLLGSCLSLD